MIVGFSMLIALLISIIVGLLVRNRQLRRKVDATKKVAPTPSTPSAEEVFSNYVNRTRFRRIHPINNDHIDNSGRITHDTFIWILA